MQQRDVRGIPCAAILDKLKEQRVSGWLPQNIGDSRETRLTAKKSAVAAEANQEVVMACQGQERPDFNKGSNG